MFNSNSFLTELQRCQHFCPWLYARSWITSECLFLKIEIKFSIGPEHFTICVTKSWLVLFLRHFTVKFRCSGVQIAEIIHTISHLTGASGRARHEFTVCQPRCKISEDTVYVSSFYWVIFDDERREREKDSDSFELLDLWTCEIAVWLLEGHFVCVCKCVCVCVWRFTRQIVLNLDYANA